MTWRTLSFVILTLLLTGFLSYGTYRTALLLRHWKPDRNLLLIPEENVVRLLLILACIALGLLSGQEPTHLGWQLAPLRSQILVGSGVGLLLALFFYGATRVLVRYTGERFYSTVLVDIIAPRSSREMLLVLLAFIPAVLVEELLFRSLLLGGFSLFAPETALLLGMALWFGLLHSPQGLWGMIGAGLAGLIFGLLFLWHDSLVAPVVAHYIANAAQIVMKSSMETR